MRYDFIHLSALPVIWKVFSNLSMSIAWSTAVFLKGVDEIFLGVDRKIGVDRLNLDNQNLGKLK